MKMYKVLQTTSYGEWVQVKAKNEEEAIHKVECGDYDDENVISSKLVYRETTGDVEETSDE